MSKTKLSKADAEALGIDLDNLNPATFPENISPVIKADLMERWKEQNEVSSPLDMPTATERQNEAVREREAGKVDDTGSRQKDAVNK